MTKKKRGVYSKKPISSNAKPSSDAPQTKHLIRLIVGDIPQLNVCVPMRARCVVNWSSHKSSEILQQNVTQVRYNKSYHQYRNLLQSPCIITSGCTIILFS